MTARTNITKTHGDRGSIQKRYSQGTIARSISPPYLAHRRSTELRGSVGLRGSAASELVLRIALITKGRKAGHRVPHASIAIFNSSWQMTWSIPNLNNCVRVCDKEIIHHHHHHHHQRERETKTEKRRQGEVKLLHLHFFTQKNEQGETRKKHFVREERPFTRTSDNQVTKILSH